jgi:tetratricopeptide (TPR) repeat protein
MIIDKYLKELERVVNFKSDDYNNLIFRGQPSCLYELQSSAKRRLEKSFKKDAGSKFVAEKDFVKYHLDMIDSSLLIDSDKNNECKGIELLAQIQHHGGATLLTDFTRNYLVALWFASKQCDKKCPKSQENITCALPYCSNYTKEKCLCKKDINCGGRVFVVDVKTRKNKKTIIKLKNSSLLKNNGYKVEELLFYTRRTEDKDIKPMIWFWEPRGNGNNRIRSQSSVFLFGLPSFDNENIDYNSIIIDENDKMPLRNELRDLFNISAETLFPDLPGFSQMVNGEDKKYEINTCLNSGIECFENESFDIAIAYFEHAISCADTNEKFCDRGKDCKEILDKFYYYLGLSKIQKAERCNDESDFKELYKEAYFALNKAVSYLDKNEDPSNEDPSKEDPPKDECVTLDDAVKHLVDCLYTLKEYQEALKIHERFGVKYSNYVTFKFTQLELHLLTSSSDFLQILKEVTLSEEDQNSECHVKYLTLLFRILYDISQRHGGIDGISDEYNCEIDDVIKDWKSNKSARFDGRIYWDFADLEAWVKGWGNANALMNKALMIITKYKIEQDYMVNKCLLRQKNHIESHSLKREGVWSGIKEEN